MMEGMRYVATDDLTRDTRRELFYSRPETRNKQVFRCGTFERIGGPRRRGETRLDLKTPDDELKIFYSSSDELE